MRWSLPLMAGLAVLCLTASAAAGQPQEGEVVKPFNGENLDGWKLKGPQEKSHWTVGYAQVDPQNSRQLAVRDEGDGSPQLVNAQGGGVDVYTEQTWGDQNISLELMVPKGSNSGVYVMGEYEVQVLDSNGGVWSRAVERALYQAHGLPHPLDLD